MKATVTKAPWVNDDLTPESLAALELIDGSWREACSRFVTMSQIKVSAGKSAPKGIQFFLNEVLTERFVEAGWDADDSRFRLNSTWVRVTFRHQMSLGSDLLDAVRLSSMGGVTQCLILAAGNEFLRIITPSDAMAICSAEKFVSQVARLNGAISAPIFIGELAPSSKLSTPVSDFVFGTRLRR